MGVSSGLFDDMRLFLFKAICNLAVWCISIQQLGDGIVGSRINLLLPAVVHALDNPFGSLSTTFEAMQVFFPEAINIPFRLLWNGKGSVGMMLTPNSINRRPL